MFSCLTIENFVVCKMASHSTFNSKYCNLITKSSRLWESFYRSRLNNTRWIVTFKDGVSKVYIDSTAAVPDMLLLSAVMQ